MRLLEVVESTAVKVDRESGVIAGVKILGRTSRNGRVYSAGAIKGALPLYEGRSVNFNHARGSKPGIDRPIEDRCGWLQNVREDTDGGLSGDLHYLKSDPRSDKVAEAAERKPGLFGLSHDAEGKVSRQGSTMLVEKINAVRSVDIVSDPATTRSLFESMEGGNEMPEEVGLAPETPAAADPAESVKSGFEDAAISILQGEGDKKEKLAKLKELLTAEEKAMAALAGKPSEEAPAAPAEEPKDVPESIQKLQAKIASLEAEAGARTLLESAGVAVHPVRVKALAALPEETDRKALLETWPKLAGGAEKPRSGGAERLTESRNTEPAPKAEEWAKTVQY